VLGAAAGGGFPPSGVKLRLGAKLKKSRSWFCPECDQKIQTGCASDGKKPSIAVRFYLVSSLRQAANKKYIAFIATAERT
jgi:hypothetical protein